MCKVDCVEIGQRWSQMIRDYMFILWIMHGKLDLSNNVQLAIFKASLLSHYLQNSQLCLKETLSLSLSQLYQGIKGEITQHYVLSYPFSFH